MKISDSAIVLIATLGSLGLSGCAGNDGHDLEASSSTKSALSGTGGARRITYEEFVNGGGQPTSTGGDEEGTHVYRCPAVTLQPSVDFSVATFYASSTKSSCSISHDGLTNTGAGNTRTLGSNYPPDKDGYYLTDHIACEAVLGGWESNGTDVARGELRFVKTFASMKLCKFDSISTGVPLSFTCKDVPLPNGAFPL
ncbi:MAG: hypothetical protein U0174_22765 [Polyangiaceae bacterium]